MPGSTPGGPTTGFDGGLDVADERLPDTGRHAGAGPSAAAPSPAGRRRRWPWVVGIVVVALAVLAAIWDWNWFKGPIERQVSAATGREFRIEGDLRVRLGSTLRIGADGLRLANAEWAAERDMVNVGRLDVGVELWPLFRKQLVLPWIRVEKPVIHAERDAQGRNNWTFEPQQKDESKADESSPMALPRIGELTITDGKVAYREPDTDVEVDVASRVETGAAASSDRPPPAREATGDGQRGDGSGGDAAAMPGSPPLDLKGRGRYRGQDFTLEAHVDSPLDLQRSDRPYRVDVEARAGKTRATVEGAISHPLQLADFSIRVALEGPNLAELTKLAGTALPKTPPYSLDGQVTRRGKVFAYEDFKGKIGDSDIAGTASYEPRDPRPMLRADLRSRRLDLDDLAGLIGAPPATGKGETASAAQKAEAKRAAERAAERSRVLPHKPFDLAKLRSLDADVKYQATRISSPSLPISAIDTRIKLDNGKLRVEPLEVGAAGGRVQGHIALDASGDPVGAATKLRLRDLQLPKLAPGAEALTRSAGTLSGTIELAGRGNSVASLLATADGEVAVGIGKGRLSNLLIELAGLDIAESLAFLVGKDKLVTLRCAWVQASIKDGVVEVGSSAFDTTDTVLYLQGKTSLADESLALRLVPQPKDMSPLAVRTPIDLNGSYKAPKPRPDPGPLLVRGAAAAVLYAIAPPAALLALIETGPGNDTDCGRGDGDKRRR